MRDLQVSDFYLAFLRTVSSRSQRQELPLFIVYAAFRRDRLARGMYDLPAYFHPAGKADGCDIMNRQIRCYDARLRS